MSKKNIGQLLGEIREQKQADYKLTPEWINRKVGDDRSNYYSAVQVAKRAEMQPSQVKHIEKGGGATLGTDLKTGKEHPLTRYLKAIDENDGIIEYLKGRL
ncbi:MAG: hypothetical protein ACI9N9_000087 [Enterobacterales bacterium]|jgi:hypothetical protein